MLASRHQRGPDAAMTSTLHDLDRLLSRLETQVLSEQADPELRSSVFLRRKTGANIEFARTLLIRLEHDASTVKIASQRQTLTSDLQAKRDLIKQLNRHLIELDQLDTASDEEEEDATPQITSTPPSQPTPSAAPAPPHNTQPSLRARKPQDTAPDSATTSALFSGRKDVSSEKDSLRSREDILTTQAQEQEAIKASLVSLASALKESNINFSQSLEEEKNILDRAASGLDKNALGMESAGRRMGTLRKMTEGQGWWGRIKLYAIIGVLWLACFLLVFVGPKLRF
ncbi:hypothetical protein B9Z65_5834 [Elsinoe australis]|uniref:Synaptobrevin n=1 Tax=Elsinoe australis TaxID=40998 RepID=A0A2P7YJ88_9PEZI|nr:hypothetical protein B9Z65_5834 [Elsinoe australis]